MMLYVRVECFTTSYIHGLTVMSDEVLAWLSVSVNMVQLMPLPTTDPCFCKIQIDFTFLVPSHPGALNRCCFFCNSKCRLYVLLRNSFSQLVGEEFLKFFDFSGDALDVALRRFVRHLTPTSEPQDCDQMLSHFAHRYHCCNNSQYKSAGNSATCLYLAYFLPVHTGYSECEVHFNGMKFSVLSPSSGISSLLLPNT